VEPGTCGHCGGSNAGDVTICQWCGSALTPVPSIAPLSTGYKPLTLPPPTGTRTSVPPGAIAAVVIVVVLVIILVAVASSFPTTPSLPNQSGSGRVVVTQVVVRSTDNACGLNGANQGGFSIGVYESEPLGWYIPSGSASVPCSVSAVSTNTPGFSVEGSLPAQFNSSGNLLFVSVFCEVVYDGPLNITFT
jgi:hypothetical protein